MQINSNISLQPGTTNYISAKKVIDEIHKLAEEVSIFDNTDKVDLNPKAGDMEMKETPLKDQKGVYTGSLQFDPETKQVKDLFITKNHEKYGGVGTNYRYLQMDDNTDFYYKDEMYQEFPLGRYIEEIYVDRNTHEVKSYEARDEVDNPVFMPGPGSDADCFNIAGFNQ